jgi:DNA polymerase-3 subunit beta
MLGFDLVLAIETSFDAEVEEEGVVTLPAKLFGDIVGKIPHDASVIISVGEKFEVIIETPTGKYLLRGIDEKEYPKPPIVDQGEAIVIAGAKLATAFKGTIFACSSEETKQVLCGVHLKSIPDSIEFAATDGHRLSVIHVPCELSDLDLVLPTKAIQELSRIAGDDDVAIYVEHGLVQFVWGSQSLVTRTIDGNYPNYTQLIPQEFTDRFTVDRKSLVSALDRISVLTVQENLVRIRIEPNEQRLTLLVETPDCGSGSESLPAQIIGSEMEIAFRIKYLMDWLKVVTVSEVEFNLNSPIRPVVMKPVGGGQQIYLIMPVQIRA